MKKVISIIICMGILVTIIPNMNTIPVQADIQTTRRDALGLFVRALQDPQTKKFQGVYDPLHGDIPNGDRGSTQYILGIIAPLHLEGYVDFEPFKKRVLSCITPTGRFLDFPYTAISPDEWVKYTSDIYWPYEGVQILQYLGLDPVDYLNATAVVENLKALQNPDGGFKQFIMYNTSSSTWYTYMAVYALNAMHKLNEFDTTKILNYLMSCYNPKYGAFGLYSSHDIDLAYTYCAIRALKILGRLDLINRTKMIESILKYESYDYENGTSSFCESLTGTAIGLEVLYILNALNMVNTTRYIRYVLGYQNHLNGGFSFSHIDTRSFVIATYYAIHMLNRINRLDVMNESFTLDAIPTYVPYKGDNNGNGGIQLPNIGEASVYAQIIVAFGLIVAISWKIIDNHTRKKFKPDMRKIRR